jgi:hypothetical protein
VSGKAITEDTIIKEIKLHNEKKKTKKRNLNGGEKGTRRKPSTCRKSLTNCIT